LPIEYGYVCANCSMLLKAGAGIRSSKTGHLYCSTRCRNVADSRGSDMEPKQKFGCECGEVFSTTDDLMKHKSEGLCDATRTEAHKAVEEQVTKESKKMEAKLEWKPPHVCEHLGCGKGFETKASLSAHKRSSHSISRGLFTCPNCERTFTFITYVRNHLVKAHGMKRHDAEELIKTEAVGSKAKAQRNVNMAAIESKEAQKYKTEVGKSLGVKGEAGRALDRYADKVVAKLEELQAQGYFCNNCCIMWLLDPSSLTAPKYCSECGTKLGEVKRRYIYIKG
jgi:hypothetical protein